jgi:hypothetical protein
VRGFNIGTRNGCIFPVLRKLTFHLGQLELGFKKNHERQGAMFDFFLFVSSVLVPGIKPRPVPAVLHVF